MGAQTPPSTTTKTNHGLYITVGGSLNVGAITSWGPRQARDATPVFAFGDDVVGANDVPADAGEAYEIVPGNSSQTTISIARYDIWKSEFEVAFGTSNLEMLTRQKSNIQFREFFKAPDGSESITNIYYGAWFTSLGRTDDAKGDRIVLVSAEAMFTRRRRG